MTALATMMDSVREAKKSRLKAEQLKVAKQINNKRRPARFRPPKKFSGDFLYKYHWNVGWLEPIILKGELYFPTPGELNDPNEARPTLSRNVSPERFVTAMYNNSLESALSKGYGPTEHLLYAAQGLRKHGVERLMEISEQDFHQQFENSRTYSVSKRPDNLRLWEEYAENHSGYCLEFRCEGLFSAAYEMRYEEGVELDITDDDQIRPDFFFYKTPAYSREEEIRLIRARTDDPIVSFEPITLLT